MLRSHNGSDGRMVWRGGGSLNTSTPGTEMSARDDRSRSRRSEASRNTSHFPPSAASSQRFPDSNPFLHPHAPGSSLPDSRVPSHHSNGMPSHLGRAPSHHTNGSSIPRSTQASTRNQSINGSMFHSVSQSPSMKDVPTDGLTTVASAVPLTPAMPTIDEEPSKKKQGPVEHRKRRIRVCQYVGVIFFIMVLGLIGYSTYIGIRDNQSSNSGCDSNDGCSICTLEELLQPVDVNEMEKDDSCRGKMKGYHVDPSKTMCESFMRCDGSNTILGYGNCNCGSMFFQTSDAGGKCIKHVLGFYRDPKICNKFYYCSTGLSDEDLVDYIVNATEPIATTRSGPYYCKSGHVFELYDNGPMCVEESESTTCKL